MKKIFLGLFLLGSFSVYASEDVKVIKIKKHFNTKIACSSDLDAICRAFDKIEAIEHTCGKVFNVRNALQGKHGVRERAYAWGRLRVRTINEDGFLSYGSAAWNGQRFLRRVKCI